MMEPDGIIFDIHRFSLTDGPGIRTVLFFKGCPLNCTWCHNYESKENHRQLYFDAERCTHCGNCALVCPSGVHAMIDGSHHLNLPACTLSSNCVEVCSPGALKIIGEHYTVDEIISEVEKDRLYYQKTKGGITLSGGEPMAQFPFVLALVNQLKSEAYHVCVDTSGLAPELHFKKILPYVDLFHYDIKALDKQVHLEQAGADNEEILKNLKLICHHDKKVILRCPIIPGVNDTASHFSGVANLANDHPSIERIDLLPYHSMGAKKEVQMNQDQSPRIFPVPSEDEKLLWLKIIRKYTEKEVNLRG